MRTTSQLRSLWGPPCNFRKATVSLYGAGKVTVDVRIVDAVRALDAVLRKHNYRTRWADTGAFVCRRITGGTGHSLHSYGIALDINWQSNPYSSIGQLVTDMKAPMVADIKAIRTKQGHPVWGWGGDYHSIKDAMHWEVVASPAELATGIHVGADEEEFTMDPEAKKAFDAVNLRLDAIGNRMDEAEKNRLEPTTRRVRELWEKLVGK